MNIIIGNWLGISTPWWKTQHLEVIRPQIKWQCNVYIPTDLAMTMPIPMVDRHDHFMDYTPLMGMLMVYINRRTKYMLGFQSTSRGLHIVHIRPSKQWSYAHVLCLSQTCDDSLLLYMCCAYHRHVMTAYCYTHYISVFLLHIQRYRHNGDW